MTNLPDYYATLSVPPTANREEIRTAFRCLARRHHPDVNPVYENDVQANEFMRQIITAYEVLNNPQRRAAYDRQRWAQGPRPQQETSARPWQAGRSSSDDASWGPQTGGGRWRPPRPSQVVYDQSMPSWLESFFAVEEHLKERLQPLATRVAALFPVIVLSGLLIFAFAAYNGISNDPDAVTLLTCIINAFGGIWVFFGVLGVVFLFFLVAWYAVWRAWHD